MLANIPEPAKQPPPQRSSPQLETLGMLTSGVAHDFNNILTSILGQASLALVKLPHDNDARHHIEKAVQAAQMATSLTRQLLTLASGANLQDESIDINELIAENSTLLRMLLPDGIHLHLDLNPDIPLILAKRAELQQILLNLVINGVEAIVKPVGDIVIRTSMAQRQNNGSGSDSARHLPEIPAGFALLQVSDNGSGMSRETMVNIFDPFFTTKSYGKGVGLATVQQIVANYNGGITVDSEPGKGTTFTIFLPYSQPSIH